jgi:L-malate glycosyltransferase
MKVLTISSWFPNKIDDIAGSFVLELAKFQRDERVEVSIIFADLDIRNARFLKHWTFKTETKLEKGVPVSRLYGLSVPKMNMLTLKIWTYFYLKLYERHIREFGKPDIVHAHNYFAGFVALEIHKKYGIPYVFTEHLSAFIFETVPIWQHDFIKELLENAAKIVVPGEGLRQKLQLFTERRIDIVPNLVNTEAFVPASVPIADDVVKFVYLGNLVPLKNVDKIIEAFAALKTKTARLIHLNIVGFGVEFDRLNQLTADLNCQNDITFFRQVQQPEAIRILQSSHILVLNSDVETFGIAVVEGLAVGLPVIVSRCGGPETVVNDAVGRFVELKNTKELTDVIYWMLSNYKNFDPKKLHDYAHLNFGKQAIVKQWIKIYEAISNLGDPSV